MMEIKGIICVDCKELKQGREIYDSWQFGASKDFRCLCIKCKDKRDKLKARINGEKEK